MQVNVPTQVPVDNLNQFGLKTFRITEHDDLVPAKSLVCGKKELIKKVGNMIFLALLLVLDNNTPQARKYY